MDSPTTANEAVRRHAFHVAVAIELAIIALGAAVYVVVRELTEGSPARAVENALWLFDLEQRLGIDHELTLHALVLQHEWLRTAANWIYIWGHWPVIIGVAAWLYVHRRERYWWLRNAMFTSGLLAFFLFALVPMAPPRLAGIGYVDTITVWSSSYRVLQPPDYANLYAAMPSLHFGWDLLVGVALFTSTSFVLVRAFALLMPTLMAFSVIATANHWVLDIVAGMLVVGLGVVISERMSAVRRRRFHAPMRAREPIRESA